jgi:DNA-binding winged helix-turn-helix (wHTH) protein/TolB-like protein/Flp pilus assembly protein TadD
MVNLSGNIYVFGPFRLDVTDRSLRRDGELVPLTAKAFDVLVLLVENCGRVVGKQEFMDKVWSGSFVEEANLTQNIFTLRRVLGDEHGRRGSIQTVPGHGYRFAAAVQVMSGALDEPERAESIATVADAGVVAVPRARAADSFHSLLVLPFINECADATAEYLSDGITESVINSLACLEELRIIARSTAFRYKGTKLSHQQIGRELGVRAVLEGRVLQMSDQLIIRTELTDVENGWQLWGEQFNRPFSDTCEVQDEIAHKISDKLNLHLKRQEQKRITKHYTDNVEAYMLYLKGRYYWNKYTHEDMEQCMKFFWQAIDVDPTYALAYAGLADCYYRLSNLVLPPREAMPKARAAAIKALEIDETLAEAHASLGLVKLYYDWDFVEAGIEFRRAIELKPGSALSHQRYGLYLDNMRRFEEAKREFRLALELDPLSPQIATSLAGSSYFARKFEEAIEEAHKALVLDARFFPARLILGMAYEQLGKFPEAIAEFEAARALAKVPPVLGYLGHAYAMSGKQKEARKVLAELDAHKEADYLSPYLIALVMIELGETDKVFELLEKAYQEKNEWLGWLNTDPRLDSLRSDPRFQSLLQRVGHTPEMSRQANISNGKANGNRKPG